AASDDVKRFGAMMVHDHTKANDELKQLAEKKSVSLPTDLGEHQADYDRLAKLSGADFDHQYMSTMVEDHKKDISEFETEANNGQDPDVKKWASDTLP